MQRMASWHHLYPVQENVILVCRLSSGSSTLSRVLEGGQPRKPWQMWPRTGSLQRAELARTMPETGSHDYHPMFLTRLSSRNSTLSRVLDGQEPSRPWQMWPRTGSLQSMELATTSSEVAGHEFSTYLPE